MSYLKRNDSLQRFNVIAFGIFPRTAIHRPRIPLNFRMWTETCILYVRKIPLQFALRLGIRVKNGVLWALFSSWGRDRSSQNLNLLDMLSAETLPSCFGRVNSSKEIYNRCIFDMKHTYSKIRSLSLNIIPETLQTLTTDITVDLLWRLNFQIIVPHLRCWPLWKDIQIGYRFRRTSFLCWSARAIRSYPIDALFLRRIEVTWQISL